MLIDLSSSTVILVSSLCESEKSDHSDFQACREFGFLGFSLLKHIKEVKAKGLYVLSNEGTDRTVLQEPIDLSKILIIRFLYRGYILRVFFSLIKAVYVYDI